ncbi:MAG: LacI family DNA-binding transcriptional regulator [Candidatus Sumerlaeaceae bacterium]
MQKRRSRYTIRDIARMAGVSRSTVSLAINDSPRINKETRKQVMQVIAETGYRPNHAARNLASRTSRTILVILPEMDQAFTDGYFSESLSGILDAGAAHDYHLMIQSATELFKRENRPLKLFRQHTIDAVLLLGNLQTDNYVREIAENGCPIVLVNGCFPGIPSIVGAAATAASDAVTYLHSLGHSRIAHISGNPDIWAVKQRTNGYHTAIETLQLDRDDTLVARGNCSARSGFEAMKQLLARDNRPTAVFCATDILALGAVDAIRESGLAVPHDIAVFGGDDALAARFVSPRLSTIQPLMYTIGESACEHLVRFLEGNSPQLLQIEVRLPLAVRQSCGSPLCDQRASTFAEAI